MLKEKILECLKEMETSELIQIHNEYCDATNNVDNNIYSMDDFEILCGEQDALWIACRIFYGDFNPNDDFIFFNAYGNFITGNDYNIKEHIYISDIANHIIDNNDSLYNDDIQEILDEVENEND